MMRHATNAIAALLSTVLFVLLGHGALASAQPSTASTADCQAENNFVAIAGIVHVRAPYFVEVELSVHNKSAAALWIDPARITLVPDDGRPIATASSDQVVHAPRGSAPVYIDATGIIVSGSFAIGVGIGPIDLRGRTLEARFLRAQSIPGDARQAGSVYFNPKAWPARFDLAVNGLRLGAGASLPALSLRGCVLRHIPKVPPQPLAQPIPSARRIEVAAQATRGPVTMKVSAVELGRFATTLTVAIENASDREMDLFTAYGHTRLVDDAGASYALHILRSDLAERVPARGTIHGRLVFEPIPLDRVPPKVTLALPGLRVGGLIHDLAVVVPL
jgi:hypothetical protein